MAVPCLQDTDTVSLSQDAGTGELTADVIVDPALDNLLSASAAGLLARYAPPMVESLPANPFDGQVVHYGGLDVNGTVWQLRYNAASASPYKWEWVGGSDLYVMVLTAESRVNAAYAATATPVEVVLPANVAGDYEISHGASLRSNSGGTVAYQAVKLGAAAASNNEAIQSASTEYSSEAMTIRAPGLVASATLALVYAGSGGVFAAKRWLRVHPVRLAPA